MSVEAHRVSSELVIESGLGFLYVDKNAVRFSWDPFKDNGDLAFISGLPFRFKGLEACDLTDLELGCKTGTNAPARSVQSRNAVRKEQNCSISICSASWFFAARGT